MCKISSGKFNLIFFDKPYSISIQLEEGHHIAEMPTLDDLDTPAFVVNLHSFRQNCDMARKTAYENGIVRLRPHVKTHKTKEGCLLQAGDDVLGGDDGAPISKAKGRKDVFDAIFYAPDVVCY